VTKKKVGEGEGDDDHEEPAAGAAATTPLSAKSPPALQNRSKLTTPTVFIFFSSFCDYVFFWLSFQGLACSITLIQIPTI
jgi:hypothetical protein